MFLYKSINTPSYTTSTTNMYNKDFTYHETIKHRVVDGAEQMPLSQSLPGLFHFIIQHHRGLAGPASFRPMLEKQGKNRKTSKMFQSGSLLSGKK
jgi:hypothetical protein